MAGGAARWNFLSFCTFKPSQAAPPTSLQPPFPVFMLSRLSDFLFCTESSYRPAEYCATLKIHEFMMELVLLCDWKTHPHTHTYRVNATSSSFFLFWGWVRGGQGCLQRQQPTAGSPAHRAQKHSTSKPQLANAAVTSASLHHISVQRSAYELHMYGRHNGKQAVRGAVQCGAVQCRPWTQGATEVLTLGDTEQMPLSHEPD